MSYSKVRAMTRIATPENEGYLLYIAENGTASDAESLVRAYRRASRGRTWKRLVAIGRNDTWRCTPMRTGWW